MDWMAILEQALQVFVIPLLGLLVKFLIDFLVAKKDEALAKTDNEIYKKYLEMLNDTIIECVNATHQTYVEHLKRDNAFSAENQKEALNKTYENVLAILSEDAKDYLKEGCGDLEVLIKNKIEAKVKESK